MIKEDSDNAHCSFAFALQMIVFVIDNKGTKEQSETTSQEQCAPTNRGPILLVVSWNKHCSMESGCLQRFVNGFLRS